MALKLKGEATFTHQFDGGAPEELTIALNVAALMRVEEEGQVGLLGALKTGLNSLIITSLLLRAGLIEGCNRHVTREQAGEILMLNGDALEAVLTALTMALPSPPEDGESGGGENPPTAARKRTGTGKRS
ncbi:hypothetical protein [Novosphingobium sp.]|uniref:hypothetical protein n=1 Tax=Novosphingobium sp. TaxID=1874826 RepID=UPI0038BCA833